MNHIIQKKLSKGLTGFQIKIIALVLMVLDHIHYFFGFTGKIPTLFSQLGRLSAGLFLFMVVEGFIHTSNRKRYFLRLYTVAILMGLVQYAMITFNLTRPDGFFPQNQIFSNFVILLPVFQGIEWIKNKRFLLGTTFIALPLLWPFIGSALMSAVPATAPLINLLHFSVLPMHIAIMDGGTFYILNGILLYLLHKNKYLQAGGYFIFNLIVYVGLSVLFIPDITIASLFTQYYEWICSFSAIFMLLYNGKRGRSMKKLFYVFYPAHVYLLFGLSCLLYFFIK